MPDMPSPEVEFLDIVAVNREIVTLATSGQKYRARGFPDHPLKEKDIVKVANRSMSSIFVKRLIEGQLEKDGHLLIFNVD
jgi:hypothetical protein